MPVSAIEESDEKFIIDQITSYMRKVKNGSSQSPYYLSKEESSSFIPILESTKLIKKIGIRSTTGDM